ncbi:18251_t:CDS:2 [Rhizophagus irregularis]|nr:18251_t:CDS:2 [Rhizophagus irregularis]
MNPTVFGLSTEPRIDAYLNVLVQDHMDLKLLIPTINETSQCGSSLGLFDDKNGSVSDLGSRLTEEEEDRGKKEKRID